MTFMLQSYPSSSKKSSGQTDSEDRCVEPTKFNSQEVFVGPNTDPHTEDWKTSDSVWGKESFFSRQTKTQCSTLGAICLLNSIFNMSEITITFPPNKSLMWSPNDVSPSVWKMFKVVHVKENHVRPTFRGATYKNLLKPPPTADGSKIWLTTPDVYTPL